MRERLIELLKSSAMVRDLYSMNEEELFRETADHLLANGVVCPPCKVGDTLYYIDTCVTAEDFGKKYVSFGRVNQISYNKHGEWFYLDCGSLFSFGDFNKTVFLTREEAERALKGGEG
jgi:hypothetical protein